MVVVRARSEYIPSQSRSEGESMPDHSISTESPDLERTVGETEIETLDSKVGFMNKKKNNNNSKIVRGTIIVNQ